MKKVCTFALAFSKEPHSSSGPGHLPLTQKIISSTLICGTKAIESKDSVAFFILSFNSPKTPYPAGRNQ